MPFWEWCIFVVLPIMLVAGVFTALKNWYFKKKKPKHDDGPDEPEKGYSPYHDIACPTCRAAAGWACETDDGKTFGHYQVHWDREIRWVQHAGEDYIEQEDRESSHWD